MSSSCSPMSQFSPFPLLSVVSYSDGEKCISPICRTQLTVRFSLCRQPAGSVSEQFSCSLWNMTEMKGAHHLRFLLPLGQDSTHFPCCSRLCLFPQTPSMVLFHRSAVWSAWVTTLWTPSSLWFLKCAFKFVCNQIPIIVLWSFWLKHHNEWFSFPKIPHFTWSSLLFPLNRGHHWLLNSAFPVVIQLQASLQSFQVDAFYFMMHAYFSFVLFHGVVTFFFLLLSLYKCYIVWILPVEASVSDLKKFVLIFLSFPVLLEMNPFSFWLFQKVLIYPLYWKVFCPTVKKCFLVFSCLYDFWWEACYNSSLWALRVRWVSVTDGAPLGRFCLSLCLCQA